MISTATARAKRREVATRLDTVVAGGRRILRDKLPGDCVRSKTGVIAYLITTAKCNRAGEPLVKLQFENSGIVGNGFYSIADLVKAGGTFMAQTEKQKAKQKAAEAKAAKAPKAKAKKKVESDGTPDKKRPTAGRGALPKVGTVLHARYKGKDYKAKVITDGLEVVGMKGKTFPSLSAAGCAVTQRPTCAGPRFWKEAAAK